MLSEIVHTKNRQAQTQFTEKVCTWYYGQLQNSEKGAALRMIEENAKEVRNQKGEKGVSF